MDIFIFISILIHLSIFLLWNNNTIKNLPKGKEPIIVDVIDLPKEKSPKENKSNKLAERSHKTVQETRKKGPPSSGERLKGEERRIAKVRPRILHKRFKIPEIREEREKKEKKKSLKKLDKGLLGRGKGGENIKKFKKGIETEKRPSVEKPKKKKEIEDTNRNKMVKKFPKLKELLPDINKFQDSYDRIKRFNPKEGKEDKVISLNTTEFKYISYFASIKRKIELVWEYPEIARENGMQGKLFVKFIILKDGSLGGIKLIGSSGFTILDKEAIDAVKTASPFNPIPASFNTDKIVVNASFEYHLSFFYVR